MKKLILKTDPNTIRIEEVKPSQQVLIQWGRNKSHSLVIKGDQGIDTFYFLIHLGDLDKTDPCNSDDDSLRSIDHDIRGKTLKELLEKISDLEFEAYVFDSKKELFEHIVKLY